MLSTLKNFTKKDWVDLAFGLAIVNTVLAFCVYVGTGGFYAQ